MKNNSSMSEFNLQRFLGKFIVLALTIHYSLFTINCFSQGIGINISNSPPNSSALLDVDANGMSPKAGVLVPRMTTADRDAISSPIPESLLIYNKDVHCFQAYYNNSWVSFGCLGIGCQVPNAPTAGTNTSSQTQIVWNWNAVSGVSSYQWNTSSTYPGAGINVLSGNTFTQTGLTCNTYCTLNVWAYNGCGNSAPTTLTQTTSSCCSVNCSGSGNIGTMAGIGIGGSTGDGGPALCAEIQVAWSATIPGIALDKSGNVYIADNWNQRIRKITASTGIISTIAGNGTAGFTGDGGQATNAELNYPAGVAIDASGNVYIADAENNRIRKISTSGIISTFAGNGTQSFSGDGGPATAAELNSPEALTFDLSGNLLIADSENNRIRKVNTSGNISTFAGTGSICYSGDGGQATNAEMFIPTGVAVDNSGNVYIADYENDLVRKVNTSGIISTFAGVSETINCVPKSGYTGDGGPATNARMGCCGGGTCAVTVDGAGNVYICDNGNDVVRKVNTSGIISTFAGTGTNGYSGDGGAATNAEMYNPYGVAVDALGNVYVLDAERVRKICK